jgi:hypothetical protein
MNQPITIFKKLIQLATERLSCMLRPEENHKCLKIFYLIIMRIFLLPILLLSLITTGCTPMGNQSTAEEIKPQVTVENLQEYNGKDKGYQEIETKLTQGYYIVLEGKEGQERQGKEIERLKQQGVVFRHDKSRAIPIYQPIYTLRERCSSEGTDCKLTTLSLQDKDKFPEYTFGKCYNSDHDRYCEVLAPRFPQVVSQKRVHGIYGAGRDVYIIGSNAGDSDFHYTLFQNDKQIFSRDLWPEHGLLKEAKIVLNSPAFGFSDIKNKEKMVIEPNIFYKGATINEKYGLEASNFLFSFKDKIGFIGKKNEENFIVFNGHKISENFDEIGPPPDTIHNGKLRYFSINVYENGIIFFTGKRGEKYFFTEIDLNEYL